MSRDSQTDSSRDGAGQLRKSDPDVMAINSEPWTLADEKRYDPDAPGTASDYRGTTSRVRDPKEPGAYVNESNFFDPEDR